MPPKKISSVVEDKLEEIRKSLNFMSDELSKVAKQQTMLLDLMDEVKQLKNLVKEKDKKIEGLERRIDELEQYTRLEDLMDELEQYTRMEEISGLETKHRMYASTVARDRDGEDALPEELKMLVKQVIKFFESQNMNIQSDNVVACHTLPRRNGGVKPAIVVRFVNQKHKAELLRQAKKLKGTGVYLNEHLTKKNADIARRARILRKQNKIQATWTRNCKVMIRLNGTPEEAKVYAIRELQELDQYG